MASLRRSPGALRAARNACTVVLLAAAAFIVLASVQSPSTFGGSAHAAEPGARGFHLEEATITDIQRAIRGGHLTTAQLVRLYLNRIKAYNGTCVSQPEGILGPISPIAHAKQVNALITLNLRPTARRAWGFDDRKARTMTDSGDDDPAMPDALETADQLDAYFARTNKLVGPLHGVVLSIKDMYDTFDMRSTSGADAQYANDRPPNDATFVKRLRDAGAIIIAKANAGEYASGFRSAFGGTTCNAYDTTRTPGSSSGGSGASVAANLVTCSVGEETGGSVRNPSRQGNIVGIAATQELVSRDGLIQIGLNTRVGPMCRTVEDVAKVLDVIAGYDPKDELTAFSVGRLPSRPYPSFAKAEPGKSLLGLRIGVIREYMDKSLYTLADADTIDLIDGELASLRSLGATLVDPGPGGALFQDCIKKYDPGVHNKAFIAQYPDLFPAGADHIPLLVSMYFDPSLFPTGPSAPSVRALSAAATVGEGKYYLNLYLKERGDKNIANVTDLANKSTFYTYFPAGTNMVDIKARLVTMDADKTLDNSNRLLTRFAFQQMLLQCMAQLNLDALTAPSGNIPSFILGAPVEPAINGRTTESWGLLGQQGFPAIAVPAGFTRVVYDRVLDSSAPGGTRLVGPVPAALPVGIDFIGRPFDEPLLFRIGAAYEAATRHRTPPPDFGPLKGEP